MNECRTTFQVIGGPLTYLGLVISLLLLWGVSKVRGVSLNEFGMSQPSNWFHVILKSLVIGLGIFLVVKFVINPVIASLPYTAYQDLSRFDYLEGHLPNLLIMLLNIWITAAFLEEFLFRGYLMNRIMDLLGRETRFTWGVALLGQAVIFGLVHAYQSPAGMFKVGLIGLVFGISYLVTGRNLWPLILAHGSIDSLDMIGHYFGG